MIPHVLIAPNAFKHALAANEAAQAIKIGLMQSNFSCTCECFPTADGGDGTAYLILNHFNGLSVDVETTDPLGRKITASFGLIDNGSTAVIEIANASGLRLLRDDELNPMQTTTLGTGKQIEAALDMGVKKIILGLGGSATIDGGCGLLYALGLRFFDVNDALLQPIPSQLTRLNRVDDSMVDQRIKNCDLVILCDVANELLGSNGAASTFGVQKGATEQNIIELEAFLTNFAIVTRKHTGKNIQMLPFGGAAGGVAAGLWGYLHANLVDGAAYFLELTEFDRSLKNAHIVITGEGSIDHQTLQGKGPLKVAMMAKQRSLPVIGVAGRVPLNAEPKFQPYFDVLFPINHQAMTISSALPLTRHNLVRTATLIGNLLAIRQ